MPKKDNPYCPFCGQLILNHKIWFGLVRVGAFRRVYEHGQWVRYHKTCWDLKLVQLSRRAE